MQTVFEFKYDDVQTLNRCTECTNVQIREVQHDRYDRSDQWIDAMKKQVEEGISKASPASDLYISCHVRVSRTSSRMRACQPMIGLQVERLSMWTKKDVEIPP